MKITTQESQAEQARRLAAKAQDQRMVNEVVCRLLGTGRNAGAQLHRHAVILEALDQLGRCG